MKGVRLSSFGLEALEPRVLLSADGAGAGDVPDLHEISSPFDCVETAPGVLGDQLDSSLDASLTDSLDGDDGFSRLACGLFDGIDDEGNELEAAVIETAPQPDRTDLLLRVGRDHAELLDADDGTVLGRTPLAGLGELIIHGNDGIDDTLTISFPDGMPEAPLTLTYHGGDGGFDTLNLSGALAGETRYEASGPDSGSIVIESLRMRFTGLEPIVDMMAMADRTFTATAGDDEIVLRNADTPGMMTIESRNGTFESITFPNPTNSLTLEAGGGNDEVHIESVDPAFVPRAGPGSPTLHLNFGGATDTLFVSHAGDLTVLNTALDGGPDFHLTFDDVPEQVVVSGGALSAAAYSGVAVLIPGVPDWAEEGPHAIGSASNQSAPYPQVGAAESVLAHPFNERILFAGTVNGGVWRSVDGGSTWTALTDEVPSLAITALAIHSHDADGMPVSAATPVDKLVVFAGTGRHSSAALTGGFPIGVLRSMDGGDTWSLVGGTDLAGLSIASIVSRRIGADDVVVVAAEGAAIREPTTVRMATGPTLSFADANPDTITRSGGSWLDDGFAPGQVIEVTGTTWNDTDSADASPFVIRSVTDLVITLESGNVLVNEAGVMGVSVTAFLPVKLIKKGGLFRSTDLGDSFTVSRPVDPALGFYPAHHRFFPQGSVTDVVLDPGNVNRMYASIRGGGVYRSDNGGMSWTAVNTNLNLTGDGRDNDLNGLVDDAFETAAGAQRILLSVQADPASGMNAVYAALVGINHDFIGAFRSTDLGGTWALIGTAPAPPSAQMATARFNQIANLNFVDNGAGGDTITRDGGSWIREGFSVGHRIRVATTMMNNGTYTVAGVTDTTLTLSGADMLNNEMMAFGTVNAIPVLTFANANPDTITRNGGNWLADGFAPGHQITVAGSTNNNGTYTVAAATPAVLTLVATDMLNGGPADPNNVTVTASAPAFAGPSALQPQAHRGSQGMLHFSVAADAAGNFYLGGDRPPHLFRWDQTAGMWDTIVGLNATGTAAHADSRFITFDRMGAILEADDGGVYRLLNPGAAPTTLMTGTPTIRFHDSNPDQIERTAGNWVADGFFAGQRIGVDGSDRNDGAYTIQSVTATRITLVPTDQLIPEPQFSNINPRVSGYPALQGNPNLTFADANPDTITRSAGSWVTDGFVAGRQIEVSGAGANDGIYQIANVTATVLTLRPEDTLTAAAAANGIRVWQNREWKSLNGGLGVTEIFSVAYDPISNVVIAGTQDNGVIEQPYPLNMIDDDGDGIVDDPDERFRWSEVEVAEIRPGDGNIVSVAVFDVNADGQFDKTVRYTMSNNLGSLGRRSFDANGAMIVGSGNLVGLATPTPVTRTFTVTTATDQLTINRHGLSTGDGPLVVSTTGAGTLPAGLSADAVYWAIRVDNSHIRLATSEGNARAGMAVDLTSIGSGTRQLTKPFISFSAADINTGSDVITIPGHGLANGAGPFTLMSSDGATIPGGTFQWADYRIIRVNANQIQLTRGTAAVNLTAGAAGTFQLVQRFSALDRADARDFTRGFRRTHHVVNTVDSSRMLVGLYSLYGSRNLGTAANPAYLGLDAVERIFNPVGSGRFTSLVYGGVKNGVANPDIIYAVRNTEVFVRLPNAMTGNPVLVFQDNGAMAHSIRRTVGDWAADGFAAGQQIQVSGSMMNNGTYRVASVAGDTLTLSDADILNNEPMAMNVAIDLFNVETPPGATEIKDLVLDPTDHDIAFAVTDSRVYMRTGPGTWEVISQRLGNAGLQSIEVVKAGAQSVVLVGGVSGISRAINPAPGVVWTELGRFLPNAPAPDIDFIERAMGAFAPVAGLDRSDVILAGTQGRGAWLVTAADTFIDEPAAISIVGGSGNDVVRIERRESNATLLDIYVNSDDPVYTLPFDTVLSVTVNGNGGMDQVTVDSTHGPLNFPEGFDFDGGTETNQLILEGIRVFGVTQTTAGPVTTVEVEDTRGGFRQTYRFQNATLVNNLVEAEPIQVVGDTFDRFFRWLGYRMDGIAGPESELALIGRSLPRALGGPTGDDVDPAVDPVDGGTQLVQGGGLRSPSGLQRLIESGPNGFNLVEIGNSIVDLEDLRARLDALDDIPGNVTLNQSDRDSDGMADVAFDLQIVRRLTGTADLVVEGEHAGGAIQLAGNFDIGFDITLNLEFGVETVAGFFITTGGGASELVIDNIALDGELTGTGRLGFLGIELTQAELTVDPMLAMRLTLQDPSSGGTIRIDELTDALLDPAMVGGLASFNITGSAADDVSLMATVRVAALLPGDAEPFSLGDAQITATWADITDPTNVSFSFSVGAGEDLVAFLEIGVDRVLEGVETLETILDVLDVDIPVLADTLEEITGFVRAFEREILSPLRDSLRGSASFSTLQDLVTVWTRGLTDELAEVGIEYDSATKELTYPLSFSHSFETDENALPFSFDLGAGAGGLSFETAVGISGSISAETRIGFDLDVLLGGGDFADMFFLRDTVVTGALTVSFNELDLGINVGSQSVSMEDGSLSLGVTVMLDPSGADANMDEKITLNELTSAPIGDLISLSATAAFDANLPFSASLGNDLLSGSIFSTEGDYTVILHSDDLFGEDPMDVTVMLDGRITLLGQTLEGVFTFQSTDLDGERVTIVSGDPFTLTLFDGALGGTAVITATGAGHFVITDDGVAGEASAAITLAATGLASLTGDFSIRVNTIESAFNHSFMVGADTESLDLPEGPFLQVAGEGVSVDITVGGFTQTVGGDFSFEQGGTGDDRYVKLGLANVSATISAGPVGLVLNGGSGGFILTNAGLAGVANVDEISLTGVPGVTVAAVDVAVRINNTGADVNDGEAMPGPVEIQVGGTTIEIEFTGSYFHNYLAISGGAEIDLAGFIVLNGNVQFERAEIDTDGDTVDETVFKVGVTDLNFAINAGSLEVLSVRNGSGAFVITDAGVAGVADLEFEVGLIGLSGDIALELNTRSSAVMAMVETASGTTAVNLTDSDYFRLCITNARLRLGSTSIDIPGGITVEVNNDPDMNPMTPETAVEIRNKSGDLLVSIESDGTINTGLSFDDFANPGPFEFVSLLRQLLLWLDGLADSDAFQVEIPFTDTTLGEAFNWAQVFLDEIYSHLVSVELQAGEDIDMLIADGGGSVTLTNAKFQIQIGEAAPVEVTVNGTFSSIENPADPLDPNTLAGLFNVAFAAAGIDGQVEARTHVDAEPGVDRFVIALKPGQIAEMAELKLVDLEEAIDDLGFGPRDSLYGDEDGTDAHPYTAEQVGVETHRHTTEEFFVALGDVLGIPTTYDPIQQVYTYTVDESLELDPIQIPLNFGGDLGDLAGAEVNGLLTLAARAGFRFTLGFDLGASEVPRILSTSFVPVPANGRITGNANFQVFFNDDPTPVTFTGANALQASSTTGNNSVEDLAADLNALFATRDYDGQPVSDWLIAQKAGSGLAISVKEEHLGVINRLQIRSESEDPFAAEMGFGVEIDPVDGSFLSTSQSGIKGLFIDDAELSASIRLNTETDTGMYPDANAGGLVGSVRFGFIELSTNEGDFGTLDYEGNPLPDGIEASLGLQNSETGSHRFYLADLFEGLESTSVDQVIDGPNFEGSFLARLRGLTVNGFNIGDLAGADPEISLWIPDINDLDFNSDPYDGTNTGIFIIYPDLGHLLNFQEINFGQIIRALQAIADNLSNLSGFGFLDEKLPVIDVSINDLLDYAAKFAEIIDGAASQPAESLQESIAELEEQIESLFHLDPNILDVDIDTNGIAPTALRLSGGNGSTAAATTIDPNGDDNGFTIRSAVNGAEWNGVAIRLMGHNSVSGNNATAEWDATGRVLTIKISGGDTSAAAIVAAVAALPEFTAELAGGSGAGIVRTSSLRFTLDFTAAYAEMLPLQLDLNELVKQLAGDTGAADFLDAVTSIIQVRGSGVLEVAASASLILDFGIDLTNPSSPQPFFYDTTGVTLAAKVLGSDVEIETSIGSIVGVFIKDGTVTLDRDGDPETNAGDSDPDRGATFEVGLNDTNGDDRIYFSENWLSGDVINIALTGGLSVSLPIYAPTESIPLGSPNDENGDGHPDNELFISISNFAGLFNGEDVVTIITPDISSLFEDIDFCSILENAGLLINGLDGLLGDIEDGLRELVESNSIPLLGDGFSDAASFISDFRNGLLASIQQELDNAGGSAVTLVENALKTAFWDTLGPGGIDILVNPDTGEALDPELGSSQLVVVLDCEAGLVVNLRLKKEIALVDTSSNPIDFDIGVPGFGLEVDGNVSVSIGFDLKFGFGLNKEDGFYFNSSAGADDPELQVFFQASIPSLALKGQLAFLQLDIADDVDDPSSFVGRFVVDLTDPNNDGKLTWAEITSSGTQFEDLFDAGLEAVADLNLDLAASFGGDTAFPRVVAEFHLDWMWDLEDGSSDPEIMFSNIGLDLGTFISDFLDPILTEIRKVTEPLDPIIEIATARLPVLSDLAGETITLLDLARLFGVLEPSTVDFIESVLQVIDIINGLPTGTGSIVIPFGSFMLDSDSNGMRNQVRVLDDLGSTDFAGALAMSTEGPGTSETYMNQVSGFANNVDDLSNFKIPVFDDPSELFNLFTGDPVRLIEWRMPEFKFEFTYTQKIPIYPPLYAHFGGTIGAKINIGFGYDTFGIQKFIDSEDKNALDLFDGFYVIDFDENGNDRPELELRGEIFAGASINLLIVEAGVTGGIFAVIEFDLNDVNDDGKVRVSEIIANAQIDPRCIFNIHGEMGLFLEAFLKIDLFFFSFSKTWRFAEITLFEFDITCPVPILASLDEPTGALTLHLGTDADDREEIDTNDAAETFIVKHVDGDETEETVEVQWGTYKETHEGVKKIIVADAGVGDDLIDLRGVKVDVDINGGAGNDTIYLSDGAGSIVRGGDGNDTIIASGEASATGVEIFGDNGNDTLTAGLKAITIHGGAGNDTISGSPEGDVLFGDAGADSIVAGDGDDDVDGGSGNDDIDGGAGNDFLNGGDGVDSLLGRSGDDLLLGGAGDDEMLGDSGNDLLVGGSGSDKAFGHGGIDLLIGDEVGTVAGHSISFANRAAIAAAIADVPNSGIQVTALTGSGNDFLIGGGNIDVLFGGDGNDFLYGGNLFANGETAVIEEDHNDFFDGGAGDDTIFGDDALGRTGDRNTGIEVRSSVWFDNNKNDVRDEEEVGFGGVTVELRKQSDDTLIATEVTGSDGSFVFTGLDPLDYYMIFKKPAGSPLNFVVAAGGHDPEESPDDSDVIDGVTGRSATFHADFDEIETAVTAGFEGDPVLSFSDVSIDEGDDGEVSAVFVVTLSGPQLSPVTVDFVTQDGSASVADGDYTFTAGTLEFGPGVLSQTVSVPVRSELKYEEHEQFELRLLNASAGVTLPSDDTATATIINDDPIPTLSISDFNPSPTGFDAEMNPIYDEDQDAVFVVTLSNPSYHAIEVDWQTDASISFKGLPLADAATPSPLPDRDFQTAGGTLVFEPGETKQTITVIVFDDDTFDTDGDPTTTRLDEPEESFFVTLSGSKYALISDDRGYGIIQDDDAPVSVSIAADAPFDPDGAGPMPPNPFETHVTEGNAGSVHVTFNVTLTKRSGKEITVNYSTSPGTAVEAVFSGQTGAEHALPDYESTPQEDLADHEIELIFAPGETMKQVTVEVFGDNRIEPDELFYVNLLNADNADIAANPLVESNHVTVQIDNDDAVAGADYGPYSIRFSDSLYFVDEPESGTVFAEITVLSAAGSSHAVAVFATVGGTATAGQDYTPAFRRLLVFGENEYRKTVLIPVHADDFVEWHETVILELRDPTGEPVNGDPNVARLIIRDEDAPEVTIEPPTFTSAFWPFDLFGIKEGSGEVFTDRDFTLKLKDGALAPPGGVTVFYETADLTARAGSDYTARSGFATIPAGTNSVSIPIPVFEDKIAEPTEKFVVRIKNPTNANLDVKDSSAVAFIYDDDGIPVTGQVFYDSNGNGFKDVGEKGINDVSVTVTWKEDGADQMATVSTMSMGGQDGIFEQQVFIGDVGILVDGTTVTSPYQGFFILLGSGDYENTTGNETQSTEFLGAEGISPFEPVGYQNAFRFDYPTATDDVGRGGTDDVIFGGPGDDMIDAGAGDDHVVGGHWMTATDGNAPINLGDYDATVTVTNDPDNPETDASDPPLHNVYDTGPIFGVDTSGLAAGGSVSGQIWRDTDNSATQNGGDPLFAEEVIVHLIDGAGNPVNSLVTTTGEYTFTGLFLKEDGSASKYIVAFELPSGWTFVSPNVGGNEAVDSDVIAGNRAEKVEISNATPSVSNVDAGVRPADAIPMSNSGGFEFSAVSYTVAQTAGFVEITIVRGNSTSERPILYRTEDGSATAPSDYESTTGIVVFGIGETFKTITIPVHDTGLGLCESEDFRLTLREPTGRPLDEATIYIYGGGEGTLTDDDVIFGGDDWDIIIGDSGHIPAPVVLADMASIGTIVYSGGPGKDTVHGGNGPDFIHGQLDDDLLAGNEGEDVVKGGLGNDVIWAELDNDDLDAEHGRDTIVSRRDVSVLDLSPAALVHRNADGDALSTFTLNDSFEVARLFGGSLDNTFDIEDWAGSAFVAGDIGSDSLLVTQDTDMVLQSVSLPLIDRILFLIQFGFIKNASVSLDTDETYHLGSIEQVTLTGGAGANVLDASGYRGDATLIGMDGNDTLIGGFGNDRFGFVADAPLGTDTITGNGGVDLLDFTGSASVVVVDLSIVGGPQTVNANLDLILSEALEGAIGGSNDDTLTGNLLDNLLLGGPGNDLLAGGPGNEIYAFDTDSPWGFETIVENVGEGNDTLDFSSTTGETIQFDLSNTGAQAVNANLILVVQDSGGNPGEIESIIGGSLGDTLSGNDFANTLRGGPGVDTLDGRGGDDFLDGGTGNDFLDGGSGNDTIDETADTNFFLGDAVLIRGTGEVDTLANIETAHLTGGPNRANTFDLRGWSGDGSLNGADDTDPSSLPPAYIDTVLLAGDADFLLTDASVTITDGGGARTILLADIEQAIIDGGAGNNEIDASGFSGQTTLRGLGGNDTLRGGSGPDNLSGGAGDDLLSGNRDNDQLDGGDGTDTVEEDYSAVTGPVGMFLSSDWLISYYANSSPPPALTIEFDQFTEIESVSLTGSGQSDLIDVSLWTSGDLTLDGGPGNDRLIARSQDDDPADGGDTIVMTDSEITFAGSSTIAFSDIEGAALTGSAGDDVLDASAYQGAAVLIGLGGDDLLIGGLGNDRLIGGDGDDLFLFQPDGVDDLDLVSGGDGVDTLSFASFTDAISVDLGMTGVVQVVAAGELRLRLSDPDIEAAIGGSGNDQITGNALLNRLTGGRGNDVLTGVGAGDVVVEEADLDFVLTDLSLMIGADVDVLANVSRAELTGGPGANTLDASGFSGETVLMGGDGNDVLIGGSDNDELHGGAGDDALRGGDAGDTYHFDADTELGTDTIEDSGVSGTDILDFRNTRDVGVNVDLGAGTHAVHAANLTLVIQAGTVIEAVIGGDQADTLTGNSADNLFLGGLGDDTVNGGGGVNTVFEFRDTNMTLTDGSLTLDLADGIEVDTLSNVQQANLTGGESANDLDASAFTLGSVALSGGEGADNLLGGSGDDLIRGGNGNDSLHGGAGDDSISGGDGDDTLNGGGFDETLFPLATDDDLLAGGTGNDSYVFDQSIQLGADTVTELPGQGFADVILGAGISGVDIDLFLAGAQVISPNLTLTLSNPGEVEDAF